MESFSDWVRSADYRTCLRFAAGGVLSAGITVGTAALLHEAIGVSQAVATAAGLASALVVNFLLTRFYVFRGSVRRFVPQLVMFLGSSGVFRALEYGAFLALHLLGVHYLLAVLMVLGVSFSVKFLVYDRFVFARRPRHLRAAFTVAAPATEAELTGRHAVPGRIS